MRKFCRVTALMALAIAITGCTQEADQAQAPGEDSGEVTSVESSDPTAAVEHTTMKPAAADGTDEADATESAEPDASVDDNPEADKPEETPASEEAP